MSLDFDAQKLFNRIMRPQKMLPPTTVFWWVPSDAIANPLAPTAAELNQAGVKLGFDPAEVRTTLTTFESKFKFFGDTNATLLDILNKETPVTAPVKPPLPDYAKMERPELIDRLNLLDNALASTETNVRKYMDDAKKLREANRELTNRLNTPVRTRVEYLEQEMAAQAEADLAVVQGLERQLADQKAKYKEKLKAAGAVIAHFKTLIKEMQR